MESCPACKAHFFSAVKFCPYCGINVADGSPAAAASTLRAGVAAFGPAMSADKPAENAAAKAGESVTLPKPPQKRAPVKLPPPSPLPPPAVPPHIVPVAPITPAPAPVAETVAPPVEEVAVSNRPMVGSSQIVTGSVRANPLVGGSALKKRKSSKFGVIVSMTILLALAYSVLKPSKQEEACNDAVERGMKFISLNDLVSARKEGWVAAASCTAALKPKEEALQAAIVKAEGGGNCQHTLNAISEQLDDHLLSSARNGLNQLNNGCASSNTAKHLHLRLKQAQIESDNAQNEVRKAIVDGNVTRARVAIGKLEHLNRESLDLPELKNEVDNLAQHSGQTSEPVSVPTESTPATPKAPAAVVPPATSPVAVPVTTPPAPAAKAETSPAAPASSDNSATGSQAQLDALYGAAVKAMRHGQYDQAIQIADQALAISPTETRMLDLKNTVMQSKQQATAGH